MNKLKSLFLASLLTPIVATSQPLPDIMGTIPNDVGGSIIFTTNKVKDCKPEELFVYTKDRTGRVGMVGCYSFLGEDIVVRYHDGSVYSYHIGYLQMNPDFERFLQSREQRQGPST